MDNFVDVDNERIERAVKVLQDTTDASAMFFDLGLLDINIIQLGVGTFVLGIKAVLTEEEFASFMEQSEAARVILDQ